MLCGSFLLRLDALWLNFRDYQISVPKMVTYTLHSGDGRFCRSLSPTQSPTLEFRRRRHPPQTGLFSQGGSFDSAEYVFARDRQKFKLIRAHVCLLEQ